MEKTLAQQLKENLAQGMVWFSFTKKDGTVRDAYGTRNPGLIELVNGNVPTGTGAEKTGAIAYWDLDVNAWRACREDSIIEIKSNANINEDRIREVLGKA